MQAVHAAQSRPRRIGSQGMTSAKGPYMVATVGDLDDDALLCHAYGHAWDQEPIRGDRAGLGRNSGVADRSPVFLLRQAADRPLRAGHLRAADVCIVVTSSLAGYRVAEPATRVTYRAEVVARRGRLTRKASSYGHPALR
jgi:hypothetical protein